MAVSNIVLGHLKLSQLSGECDSSNLRLRASDTLYMGAVSGISRVKVYVVPNSVPLTLCPHEHAILEEGEGS